MCEKDATSCRPPDNRNGKEKRDPDIIEFTKVDRDYVVQTMADNRGYCPYGLQRAFREHTLLPVCMTKRGQSYIDQFEEEDDYRGIPLRKLPN